MAEGAVMKWIAAFAFVGLVVAANWLTSRYGMVLGLVTAGTFAAGVVLLVRDWLQEAGGRWWVVACIVAGAGLSVWMSTPSLALASGVAFAASELVDLAGFTPLRQRPLTAAMALTNPGGAGHCPLNLPDPAGFPLAQ